MIVALVELLNNSPVDIFCGRGILARGCMQTF